MKGDLIEWDAFHNGLRRPGLFFALWGTTTKLAFAIAVGIAFPLLELAGFSTNGPSSGGTDKHAPVQGLLALKLLYCLPGITLKLTAIAMMRNYPITREEHERLSSIAANQTG